MSTLTYGRTTSGTPATWTLFNQGRRAKNGLVVGCVGSGKTVALIALARAARSAGHTVLIPSAGFWTDPQLERAATRTIDPGEMFKVRDSGEPVVVLADEMDREFPGDEHDAAWETAAQAGNIALVTTVNDLVLDEGEASSWKRAFRQAATSENLLVFKTSSLVDPFSYSGGRLPSPGPELWSLPPGQGYASHQGSTPVGVTVTPPRHHTA